MNEKLTRTLEFTESDIIKVLAEKFNFGPDAKFDFKLATLSNNDYMDRGPSEKVFKSIVVTDKISESEISVK